MGKRCFLSNLGSKGQRSSTLDIEVVILCLDSRALSIPPRVTISYIWTTHGTKMFPVEFGVQRSSAFDIKVAIWFPGCRALSFLSRVTISYIQTTRETKMFFIEFWVQRSSSLNMKVVVFI